MTQRMLTADIVERTSKRLAQALEMNKFRNEVVQLAAIAGGVQIDPIIVLDGFIFGIVEARNAKVITPTQASAIIALAGTFSKATSYALAAAPEGKLTQDNVEDVATQVGKLLVGVEPAFEALVGSEAFAEVAEDPNTEARAALDPITYLLPLVVQANQEDAAEATDLTDLVEPEAFSIVPAPPPSMSGTYSDDNYEAEPSARQAD